MNSLVFLPLLAAAVLSAPQFLQTGHPGLIQYIQPANGFQGLSGLSGLSYSGLPIAFQVPQLPMVPEQPGQSQGQGQGQGQGQQPPAAPAFPAFPNFPPFPMIPEQNNTQPPTAPPQPMVPALPGFPTQQPATTMKPADGMANQPANEESMPSMGSTTANPISGFPGFPGGFPAIPAVPTQAPSVRYLHHGIVPQFYYQTPSNVISQNKVYSPLRTVQPFVQQYQYQASPFVNYNGQQVQVQYV